MPFDRLATIYDRLARFVFRKAIVHAQTCFLHELPKGASILIMGGGTGWILTELFDRTEPGHVLYLEASPKMMAQTRLRLDRLAPELQRRVECRTGTEEDLHPEESFDAVLTFFFLDLFPQEKMMRVCHLLDNSLLPGGSWLFADFHIPDSHPWRFLAKVLTKIMYLFFKHTAQVQAKHLPDFGSFFRQQGFHSRQFTYFYKGMIRSEHFTKASP